MLDQSDGGKRWQVSMSWLSVYVISAVYWLAAVSWHTYFLLIPVLVGILVVVLLKKAASKKALAASSIFSLLLGFLINRFVYEPHGATSAVFLSGIFIFLVAIFAGYFVYFQEEAKIINPPH